MCSLLLSLTGPCIQPVQSFTTLEHLSMLSSRLNLPPRSLLTVQITSPLQPLATVTRIATAIRLYPTSQEDSNAKNATKTTVIEGIGGKGGAVYDVNILKRNLLQETMKAYKDELFELLSRSTPTDDAEVVDKLQALVQASPVRTTTDSNLLDGDDAWVLAYRSQFPTTVASLVLYEGDSSTSAGGSPMYNARFNFLFKPDQEDGSSSAAKANRSSLERSKKRGTLRAVVWNKAKEFCQTKQRSFKLENLEVDEDAYVMDTTSILGGIVAKRNLYALEGLSRSAIILHKESTKWTVLLGRSKAKHTSSTANESPAAPSAPSEFISSSTRNSNINNNKSSSNSNGTEKSFSMQIIYLDNDLCILTEEDGPDSPFMVYTRNQAYLGIYGSMQRKFKLLKLAAWALVSLPIRSLRTKIGQGAKRLGWRDSDSSSGAIDPILKVIIRNDKSSSSSGGGAKLRVLRLGEANGEEEDESWDSVSDPFVHLSADERQRLLKAMSVEEVEQAADTYRNSQKKFRFLRKLFGRRKTYFKKPPEKMRRPKK